MRKVSKKHVVTELKENLSKISSKSLDNDHDNNYSGERTRHRS